MVLNRLIGDLTPVTFKTYSNYIQMRKIHYLAASLLWACTSFVSAQNFNKEVAFVDLFKAGENQIDTYRIPAIVQAKDGTILAFAEARNASLSDTGNIDLVLKRSTDGGLTWSETIVVWDDGPNVCGNPAPVVDQTTGRVVLLMTWNKGSDHEPNIFNHTSEDTRRVFVTYSDDHGLTWNQPKEITATAKKNEWTWYATGPCHGIQLQKGKHKGRLVVSANHGYDREGQHNGNSSHILYSDDGGTTWQLGGGSENELYKGNESTVVELANGDVMLNMRNAYVESHEKNGYARRVAISHDSGVTFNPTDIYHDHMLIEPICQASLLNYTHKGKLSNTLLFSNPFSIHRRNMTVKKSTDSGKSWSIVFQDGHNHAAYSDMVTLSNGDVGLLYETGTKNAYDKIRFVRIPSSYVMTDK